ncbi:MAG: cytochrome c [Chloroflexi bacterium]|nr:cytochrome c [Chloroflexota bacterium]MCI0775956.1 cytochrome c [Chloroflexota bacterium]MCI0808655.1 cytochrome c [Chloroflexota bacterium]
MSGKYKYLLIVASLVALTVIAACSEEQVPTQEPVEFQPTEAVAVERPDSEPEAPPTQDVSAGDATVGQELFNSNSISACTACHSTGDNKIVGPGLLGIYERAGSRTSLDADAYIEQSLREPAAFLADDLPAIMPSFDQFSDDDVKNLIAYLKTLK